MLIIPVTREVSFHGSLFKATTSYDENFDKFFNYLAFES